MLIHKKTDITFLPPRPSLQGGFTLIELMVAVAVVGVLAVVAIPEMSYTMQSAKVRTAVSDTHTSLLFTRSEAMKTVSVAMISLTNGPASIARQGAQAAAAFLMTAPTITVFLLRQAKVIETMAHSGIKS